MEEARIRNMDELIKDLPRVDEIGKCFSEGSHYYRQDEHRVLHVLLERDSRMHLVNSLEANALNDGRVNWGHQYTEILPLEFSRALEKALESFFD